MVRVGLIGLGKMGISHCAILNAHPNVELVAVCDSSSFSLAALRRYTRINCFADYKKMIDESQLQCLVVATPTKFHHDMVMYALERGLHVFAEKPLALTTREGEAMVRKAEQRGVVNQVGYHNRSIGTFCEARRLVNAGALGDIYHVQGEAYGPVVLKEKGSTWRADKAEGGGCLFDYASHVINLIQFIADKPTRVSGTVLPSIYSRNVEDAVYSTLHFDSARSGQLMVNWSDDSHRKMSTQITLYGKLGKLSVDATECRIHLKQRNSALGLDVGWNVRYLTDLTAPVNFYLRGEEYSAQLDRFIEAVTSNDPTLVPSSFADALETDRIIEQLLDEAERVSSAAPTIEPRSASHAPGLGKRLRSLVLGG